MLLGFNFYYGAVKDTEHKWLDYEALCQRLLPKDEIVKIRYFTAAIKATKSDPSLSQRQNTYLKAVGANPLIEIHMGHFRSDNKFLPLARGDWRNSSRPRLRPGRLVNLFQRIVEPRLEYGPLIRVLKIEEKGSDVNLASHLLQDSFKGNCTKALVISNDSDFVEAIRIAMSEGVEVGVVNPHRQSKTSRQLKNVSSFQLQLRHSILESCQLPNPVIDAKGRQIHKPEVW